jgi:zinc resistance-associated protein
MAVEQPDVKQVRELAEDVGEVMGELFEQRIAFALDLRARGLPAYPMMGGGMMGPGMMGGGMGQGMMMGPGMMHGGW